MARSFKVYQGEDETPVYDLTDPTSDVHVIWEEIEAGGRGFRGESASSTIPIRDEQAETGNPADLPVGLTQTSLSRGSRWEWLDGPTGSEVIMAAGRIGTKDYSRGRQKADRAREVVMQCADRNEELTEIIVDDWVRPEETDVARVLALITAYLNGSPRATTVLANTYVAAGNTVTLPAKTYDGTNPKDILSEIALAANKNYFATIDDEVWYDVQDSTAYQAGIRISDRVDEIDTTITSCGTEGAISGSASGKDDDGEQPIPVTVGTESNRVMYVATLVAEEPTVAWHPSYVNEGTQGSGTALTLVDSQVITGTVTIYLFRLLNPATSVEATSAVVLSKGVGVRAITGVWVVPFVNQSAPEVVAKNSGTGTSSSVTVSAGPNDIIIDVAGWSEANATVTTPSETGDNTQDFALTYDRTFGFQDYAFGGAHGTDTTPSWDFTNSHAWGAMAWAVNTSTGAGEGEGLATFPPIWDVGPASTEDGLQLVSGLRLYYGQDGAYVYVNHAATAAEYWDAERSFYTNDPAINDSTKATALANAILTRLRFEERTVNVSIGPLNEDQIGCIKYGQLINIKARAISYADDQFTALRIAQLKWTTPRPGVFFARMQLDRPIKEVPYGVGPKEGHDALEQHKEGDSHPASAIVVTPFDTIAATDVQAALEEIFAEAGGGVSDHGALTGLADNDHPQYLTTTDATDDVTTDSASGASHTIENPTANVQDITLTDNCTFTMPPVADGKVFTVRLRQDATGNRTATFTDVEWPDDTAPALSTAANAVDFLAFHSDGVVWYGFHSGVTAAEDVRDAGRWEVVVDGSPPEAVYDGGDWLYSWVTD